MSRAAAAVWEFVVGDDWRVAAGVVIALGATALLSDTSVPAWWLLPLAVVGLLGRSVHAARSALTNRPES